MTPEQETAIAAANVAADFYFRSKPWIKPQEHDDLRQEAVIAAIRAIDRFRPDAGASLKTWCSKVAAWKLSEISVGIARRTAKFGRVVELDETRPIPQDDPMLPRVEAAADADAVLETVTPRQAVIFRALGEGRSVAEAAARVGSTHKAVAKSLVYARRNCAARFPLLAHRYGVA